MDENEAAEGLEVTATPIFGVYRRGYDPEQVDRYVADQQRRLDEALHRASESERKLAAAVGQLRELHRRVAVYESEARNAQPPQLDTLGERVQRILQEAWEGAYNLRQEAEREVTELREQAASEVESQQAQARAEVDELREVASREAAELIDEATRRALHIRDETERRRQAYLERVERDREQAIGQITYLYDQRQGAIAELARLQATVQATIEEMVRSPLGRPAPGVMEAAAYSQSARGKQPEGHRAEPDVGPVGAHTGERAEEPAVPRDVDMTSEPVGRADRPAKQAAGGEALAAVELPLSGRFGSGSEPTAEPSSTSGVAVQTGPMERFVRPTDREEAREASRRLQEPSEPRHARPRRSSSLDSERGGTGLSGLLKPKRNPSQPRVYDAEQEGWS